MRRVGLVPGALALLPEYASLNDPVADLRSACLEVVDWLGPEVRVISSGQGLRVARALGVREGASTEANILVVANGSATRSERAPGHLDLRAATFDADLRLALSEGSADLLKAIDTDLAAELLADVEPLVRLSELGDLGPAETSYDDDPFGVQYWVMRWGLRAR